MIHRMGRGTQSLADFSRLNYAQKEARYVPQPSWASRGSRVVVDAIAVVMMFVAYRREVDDHVR